MKPNAIALFLASSAMLSACSYIPHNSGVPRMVSPDYTATGSVVGVRAYLYGKKTVLEFREEPTFITIKDEYGAEVPYEQVGGEDHAGRFYRFNRRIDNFTVWANGRSVTFNAAQNTIVFSASSAKENNVQASEILPITRKLPTFEITSAPLAGNDLAALVNISVEQFATNSRLVDAANNNQNVTGSELLEMNNRLSELKSKYSNNAATVQVTFQHASTVFKPSKAVKKALIGAIKVASAATIHGYTDSCIAGPTDAKIAIGRAISAKQYLVDHGMNPEKITLASSAEGQFAVPNTTKQSRALNRRVEIEMTAEGVAAQALPATAKVSKH